MTLARLLSVLALAFAMALTSTAASGVSAETPAATAATVADPRGDVELREPGWNKGMDIERVRYAKSGDNLKTVIKVRNLNATTTDLSQMFYGITLYIGGRTEYVFTNQEDPTIPPSVYRVRDAKEIDCPTAKVRLAVTKDLVRITVPLACFDHPTRIAVKASSVQFVGRDTLVARDYSAYNKVINVA